MANKIVRGRTTKKEIAFIQANKDVMSIEDIAAALGRRPEMVSKYVPKKMREASIEVAETAEIYGDRPEWDSLEKQLTAEQLDYFKRKHAVLINQFGGPTKVTPTEESQVFSLLKIEIMMNSLLEQNRAAGRFVEGLKKDLRAELMQGPSADKQVIQTLERQIDASETGLTTRQKMYVELEKQTQQILRDLKATRDQRLKRADETRSNLLEYIERLHADEQFRREEGKMLALIKKSEEKELRRLADFHTFEDGQVDQPILSHQTVDMVDYGS